MHNKGSKVQIFQSCEIDMCIARVLQVVENAVVQNYNGQYGYLQFPFLIGDENGAANKGKEVHLEQAVHLVNELRHKDAKHRAQHILIKVGFRKRPFNGIIGQQTETTNAKGDGPGIEPAGEKETCKEESDEEKIH